MVGMNKEPLPLKRNVIFLFYIAIGSDKLNWNPDPDLFPEMRGILFV